MKTVNCDFTMVTTLLLSIVFSLSCSNDTDVLADAVLSDNLADEGVVVNDFFSVRQNESIILNVLSNDGFTKDDNVRITEISSPTLGSVTINEDATSITYTSQSSPEEDTVANNQSQEGAENTAENTTNNENQEENTSENDSSNQEDTGTEDTSNTETQEEEDNPQGETSENQNQNEESTGSSENETSDNEEESAPSEETTDTFTYTTEVVNDDETTSTEEGTVEIVIESSDEEETTNDEEEQTNSSNDTTTEEEEEEEDTATENTANHTAKLLFSSGFEGVTLSNQNSDYRYINGTDSNTGFSWPPKILGSTGNEQEPSGIHTINDGGNATISNRLETVVGPKGNQTTALYQGIDGAAGVTQTPYQINNIRENPDELYITYWMKIDDTSLSGNHKWRALWEYKTENYGSGGGFRMIAFIYTDNNGKAYWNFQGDRNPSSPVWEKSNFNIPVPRDEWFKVEYFFKWSEGADGRAFMKVNGQLVGEHQGATTANSKDLDFIILTQVYGDTSPMHQWVDDIEIWDGVPY